MKAIPLSNLDDKQARALGFRDAKMLAELEYVHRSLPKADGADWRSLKWRTIEIGEFRRAKFKQAGTSLDHVAAALDMRLEKMIEVCKK